MVLNRDVPYLNSLKDVIRFLNLTLRRTLQGELDTAQFQTCITAAGALARSFEIRDVKNELEKLEDKLTELQEKIALEKPAAVSEVEDHEPRED